jgi:transcriptional regulator with XRE-family HTH domain
MFHGTHCKLSYPESANLSYAFSCNSRYMETLGKKIQRLRLDKKLSQAQLGEACHVSRVAVTKWESGDTENIRLGNLKRLAVKLEIPIAALLSVDEPPIRHAINEPVGTEAYAKNIVPIPTKNPLQAELDELTAQLTDRGMVILIDTASQLVARYSRAQANSQ